MRSNSSSVFKSVSHLDGRLIEHFESLRSDFVQMAIHIYQSIAVDPCFAHVVLHGILSTQTFKVGVTDGDDILPTLTLILRIKTCCIPLLWPFLWLNSRNVQSPHLTTYSACCSPPRVHWLDRLNSFGSEKKSTCNMAIMRQGFKFEFHIEAKHKFSNDAQGLLNEGEGWGRESSRALKINGTETPQNATG